MKVIYSSLFLIFFVIYVNAKPKQLVVLNEETWSRMLNGEWMVEFFAPWCPACKSLQPSWEEFSTWSTDLEINVAQVDVTNNPGLSGRFMINALPTIYHVKDGKFRQYRGSRDKEEFISFIEEKKWQKLEEVPWWKSPSSIQMTLVSHFFKLSMVLRNIHNVFVDEYKMPFWASILIFALATVLIGIVLGLILVCVVDVLFPQKVPIPPIQPLTEEKKTPKENKETTASNDEDEKVEKLEKSDQENDKQELTVDSDKSPNSSKQNVRKRKPKNKSESEKKTEAK